MIHNDMTKQEWSHLINTFLEPHWDNYMHYSGFDRTNKASRDIKRGIDAVREALEPISLVGDEHFIYRRAMHLLKESRARFMREEEDPSGWGLCVLSNVLGEFENITWRPSRSSHAHHAYTHS